MLLFEQIEELLVVGLDYLFGLVLDGEGDGSVVDKGAVDLLEILVVVVLEVGDLPDTGNELGDEGEAVFTQQVSGFDFDETGFVVDAGGGTVAVFLDQAGCLLVILVDDVSAPQFQGLGLRQILRVLGVGGDSHFIVAFLEVLTQF